MQPTMAVILGSADSWRRQASSGDEFWGHFGSYALRNTKVLLGIVVLAKQPRWVCDLCTYLECVRLKPGWEGTNVPGWWSQNRSQKCQLGKQLSQLFWAPHVLLYAKNTNVAVLSIHPWGAKRGCVGWLVPSSWIWYILHCWEGVAM